MSLRLVGAGLPRTGTTSLKHAIESLTGEPCYHMFEVIGHRATHPSLWLRVLDGDLSAIDEIYADYACSVDWPGSACWSEIASVSPDAKVLLSTRTDAATWWRSVDRTVWERMRSIDSADPSVFDQMLMLVGERLAADWLDPESAMAGYEAHNARVRAEVPADRLVEWQPGDGWAPLCDALGVDVPDRPFPHENDTASFRKMAGLDPAEDRDPPDDQGTTS